MDPFFLANATSCSSCWRVAAAPVGLLGEQKKMMSVRLACRKEKGEEGRGEKRRKV